ncbi:SIMPL domain-containing protein [Paenibacillus wulumuqiensis]|uniref:SIMPL domain-containing protein n=1 Tax=Paenibacillus wulumuqiensis TaxID=1567107 RepID=UPI000619291D|nr:SIMPL domain-containing protein [Paenibacillus wulumuqiensis]
MKKNHYMASLLLAGAVFTSVGMGVSLPGASTAYAAETTSMTTMAGTINVSGNGKLSVKPDVAYLSVGVQTTAATAAKAQAANAQKMSKLNNLLKNKWSIAAKDIESVQFYVQPNYSYNAKDQQKVTGYTAYHTLQVTYRNMDKLGALLDEASAAGANNVGSVSFNVENPKTYEDQVIQKAMADAAAKAGSIAKAANRTLGDLVSVSEAGVEAPPVYMAQSGAMESARSDKQTEIEPGTVELNISLNVQYAMK